MTSSSNGREPSAEPSAGPEPPSATPAEPLMSTDVYRAAAELSRKLQWAIGTSWYNTTGERATKKHVDSLATRLAAQIVEELRQMHIQKTRKAP